MRYLMLILIMIAIPGAASAQDCLATLAGCTACVLPTGGVTLSDCGSSTGSTCPAFPSSLLTARPLIPDNSLQALLAERLETLWVSGNPIYETLLDRRRDFVRREALDLLEDYGTVTGKGDLWLSASENRVKNLVLRCLEYMEAREFSTGDGGKRLAVVPQSTASRGRCSSALLGYLPRRLGDFTREELLPFVVTTRSASVMSAKAEAQEELLVGLAAQLRELSPEDRREVLDHAALMGDDPEGGRE